MTRNTQQKIVLKEGIGGKNREGHFEYPTGSTIIVIPATNLPKSSGIDFWVDQDKWDEDPYGLPIYSDQHAGTPK